MDRAQRRLSLPGASFAPWLLAALLILNAPLPAFAQASKETPTQAPSGQAPESATPAPKTAASNPQSREGKRFQDWILHCKTITEGKPEACEMQQDIVNKQGAHVLLAIVGRVPNVETPGMLVLLPLGIALPPGVFLKIDDGDPHPLQVTLCTKEGCHAEEAPLKSDVLAQLKAGTKAVVGFHVYNQQGKQPQVGVPVSLLGFSAALAEVMK